MDMRLAQLGGLVRYEFQMHWRRRALRVLVIALGMMVCVAALVSQGEIGRLLLAYAQQNGLNMDDTAGLRTFWVLFATWPLAALSLAYLLPILLADTIPLDRQYGVHELVASLPLSRGVYLSGKLLGAWAAVMSGVAAVMLATAGVWWLVSGAFRVGLYLEMWLLGGGALVVLNGGLAVLIAAPQPDRRRAIVLMVALAALSLPLVQQALNPASSGSWLAYLSPMRPYIVQFGFSKGPSGLSYLSSDNVLTVAAGVVELALVWVIVTAWKQWQENRA